MQIGGKSCKGLTFALALILVLFSQGLNQVQAAVTDPVVSAESALLIDLASGRELWSKAPDVRQAPASTTKIVTALVTVERARLSDQVRIGYDPPRVEGTRIYLVEGEQKTVEELLYGMLLNSGNDAALALAEEVAGSQADFARLMNETAARLGATGSNFVNPHGLSSPEHYTTARDLARVARIALENATLARVVATQTYPWRGQAWETTLVNQNELLASYPGTIGVKTGYTSEAEHTLVAAARRGSESYLVVLLRSSSKEAVFADARTLMDYGFSSFEPLTLVRKGDVLARVEASNGLVDLVANQEFRYIMLQDEAVVPAMRLNLLPWDGSWLAGERVGQVVWLADEEEMGSVDLVASRPLPRPAGEQNPIPYWWLYSPVLGLVVLLWLVRRMGQYRRRRRERWQARRQRYLY